MRTPLVSLDLETTGLSVENDAIIEIGAVKLVNGQIVEEYSTLVNPGIPLPPETTYITGIRQEDMRGQPALHEVLDDVRSFIGDAAIIAHNASFDVSFLKRVGLAKSNQVLDTLELASILLPQMPRYGLGSLTATLNIQLDEAHRALADAKATALLYWHLWLLTLQLPQSILEEVAANGRALSWGLTPYFDAALQDAAYNPSALKQLMPDHGFELPFRIADETQSLDSDAVRTLLGPQSALAASLPSFESREEQQHMAAAISDAFNNHQHLIIEAGTGTGKSLAYLVPAALWAQQNHQRVVIATNTINLQDQLINKDIPLVNQALDKPIHAAVMKGRANYLCPRRLEAVRRRRPTSLDDLRVLTKILVWLQGSQSGDRGEINLRAGEFATWSRLSAEDEGCHTSQCEALMDGICPFYKARKRADSAEIVIVNHALLTSDATSDSRVLPEYDYLIIDEAHQFEDAVTNSQTVRIEMPTIVRRTLELGDTQKGLLADILRNVSPHVQEKQRTRLQDFALGIGVAGKEILTQTRKFYAQLIEWALDGKQSYTGPLRITNQQRQSARFAPIQHVAGQLCEYLDTVADAMANLDSYLERLSSNPIEHFADLITSVGSTAAFFAEMRSHIAEFAQSPSASHVYWIDISYNAEFHAIVIAPLSIGAFLDESIWERKRSVILTSATLETNGSFDHVQQRLQLPDVVTRKIGSPFDYRASTLLFLPTDMPEPSQPTYQKSLERGIIELATALNGRVLVLFTSYNHLRETASSVGPRLALGNITVYDQATGGSRENLLEGFRSNPRAVLMGTRSFWQGVDLPGDELTGLIIVKLPFAVPTDPIFAARSELYSNSFEDFAVPDAILRFRQGFGRLIRSSKDRGIVAVFDSRITRKKYGARFLDALPECTTVNDTVASIGTHALRWLDKS